MAFALSCAPVVRLLVFLTSATGSSSLRQVAHSMAARVSILFEAALNGMPDALKSGFRGAGLDDPALLEGSGGSRGHRV